MRSPATCLRFLKPIAVFSAIFLFALLAPIAAHSVRAQPSEETLDDYKLAVGLYNKGRWKLAAESFQSFIKKNAKHRNTENARFYLGLTLVNLEEYKQSRDVLRDFVRDYPKSDHTTAALFWQGQCSYLLDDLPAAEFELSAFVFKAPNDPLLERALPWLGEVELRRNKPDLAVKHLQQSLQTHPQGALVEDAKFFLARSYEAQKKYPEAVKLYQELAANRVGTRAAEAQLSLGARFFEEGNYTAAAQAYQRVEQQFPESTLLPLARLNRGLSLYQTGEYKQAIPLFDKSSQEAKFAAESLLWKGLSLKSLANYAEANQVLQTGYEQHRDAPQADKLLFQWADCEQRLGEFEKARTHFVEIADRWPKGPLADESVHAATAAALNAGNLEEAATLVARFDKDFPGNKLRYRQEVLKGRLQLAKNDAAAAVKVFQAVADDSDLASTKAQAQFYLAAALQKQGQHAQALTTSESLVAAIEKDKSLAEFSGVLVIRAASSLALGKAAPKEKPQEKLAHFTTAALSAQKYIALAPQGDLADQAWSVTTLAQGHAGDRKAAQVDLASFRKLYPKSEELERTVFELGEVAVADEDWEWAESLFAELAAKPQATKYHARALSELGWAQYKQKKFAEAATNFARVIAEHPGDELLPEAAFMEATALQDAGKATDAQTKFAAAFKEHGTSPHAFLAGLQSARLLAKVNRVSDADAAYEELLKRFPNRDDADKLLDEWAATNYQAEKYARADEIFRRLATDHPNSALADNARLSLAESELVGGKIDAARSQFASLAASDKSDDVVRQRAWYQIAHIELESRRWEDLRKTCRESLAKYPAGTYRWDMEFHWAEADFQLTAYKEARDRLLRIKVEKDNPAVKPLAWFPRVWVLLAESQFRLKQYSDVAATHAELKAWDAACPLLYQVDEVLGRSFKAQALFPEARAAFERVIKDSHGQATETAAKSQFHIAETFLFEKDYRTALLEYLKVDIGYKFPDWQSAALVQAGACHEALAEWKEAVQTYEAMLRDHPRSEYAPKARERLEVARKKAAG